MFDQNLFSKTFAFFLLLFFYITGGRFQTYIRILKNSYCVNLTQFKPIYITFKKDIYSISYEEKIFADRTAKPGI